MSSPSLITDPFSSWQACPYFHLHTPLTSPHRTGREVWSEGLKKQQQHQLQTPAAIQHNLSKFTLFLSCWDFAFQSEHIQLYLVAMFIHFERGVLSNRLSKQSGCFYKYTSDFLLSLFEFVVSKQQQSFPNEPRGHGSDRWKPNAMNRLLTIKWCHIDREVTPFQVLSVRVNLRMVMLSHFSLKDHKLQYNSCLNASNQTLTPKHKPIRCWHQSVMHWREREEITNGKVYGRRFAKLCVITQLVSKAIVGRLVGCIGRGGRWK